MRSIPRLTENEFGLFQNFISKESGIFFDKDRADALQFSLFERLQKRGYDTYKEYYNFLAFHPEGRLEARKLIDSVTIGETFFFRNRPQFEALIKYVLPEIIESKMHTQDKSIRIWSAGCSRGDEPYSIAIAILETLPYYSDWNISILGTDINSSALSSAKEAVYSSRNIEYMPTEYADKYFLKSGTKYILNNEVKALVNFEYHNLAKDPYSLDTMRDLDIIFCRNVTIYFDLTTTKRVIDDFYDCASDNGYLFIGHSESLWQITNKFRPIEFPQTFIYKKTKFIKEEITIHPIVALPEIGLEEITARANIEAKTISDASEGLTKKTKPTAENKRLDHMTAAALRFSNKKKYREAMLIFDKIIELNNSYVPAHFGRSILLANQESYEGAANELRTTIKLDNLHIEAYYLLGVISYKTGALKEAEEQFKKVAYLDHSVALAYYNLGNIYLTQKEFHKAEREFNNTIKTIKNTPKNSKIKFGEDFTPEILIMACENNLKEIRILKH